MQVYTVHLRREGLDPDHDIVVVKEGFCWPALVFEALWALWHRLWLAAVVMIAVSVVLGGIVQAMGADPLTQVFVNAGIAVAIGLLANDLRRRGLARAGFAEAGIVCAPDADAALYDFLRHNPDVVAAP